MNGKYNGAALQFQVVAQLQIQMTADGNISCRYEGPNRDIFNMLLKRAEQDTIPKLIAKEQQKVIEPPLELFRGQE